MRQTALTILFLALAAFVGNPLAYAASEEIEFPVKGMDCGGCAAAVNFVLAQLDGIEDFRADYNNERAWVRYDNQKLTPERIVETINERTPFEASLPQKAGSGR